MEFPFVMYQHLPSTFVVCSSPAFFLFPLFLTNAAGRCTLHATPLAEDGGQAFSSSGRFCIYVYVRLQLPSAGVQALFRINVLHLTSKSHMSGVCNRLLVHLCQWKRTRGVESQPWEGWCTDSVVGKGRLARIRPLVALRPLVAGAAMVAGATIIVNTHGISHDKVYG